MFGVPNGSIYYRIDPYKVNVTYFCNPKSPGLQDAQAPRTRVFMPVKHLAAFAKDILPSVTPAHVNDLLARLDEMVKKDLPKQQKQVRSSPHLRRRHRKEQEASDEELVSIPMLSPKGAAARRRARAAAKNGDQVVPAPAPQAPLGPPIDLAALADQVAERLKPEIQEARKLEHASLVYLFSDEGEEHKKRVIDNWLAAHMEECQTTLESIAKQTVDERIREYERRGMEEMKDRLANYENKEKEIIHVHLSGYKRQRESEIDKQIFNSKLLKHTLPSADARAFDPERIINAMSQKDQRSESQARALSPL